MNTKNNKLSKAGKRMPAVSQPRESDQLNKIRLSKTQSKKVVFEATVQTVAQNLPGHLGKMVSKLLGWTEKVNQGVREEKMTILLNQYAGHFQSLDEAISKFRSLIGTRPGSILLSKVIQILDNTTSDAEYIALLANVLKHLSDSDIEKQFELNVYILAQISRLTPQALIVLSKFNEWKKVVISGTTTTSSNTVCGDWESQAANFLGPQIGITDAFTLLRIGHSFLELESTGMILLSKSSLLIQMIGAEVYRLITT